MENVEISSPGSLYGSLTLQEALSGRSSIRNKILASVCEKLNVIEGWGTGLKRIIDFCREKNVKPPVFEEIGDLLRVNFYRPSYKNESLTDSLKENDPINLFDLIKQNPSGSYEDYAQKLNVSTATIKRKIAELKAEGKIVREGSNKDGFWKTEK